MTRTARTAIGLVLVLALVATVVWAVRRPGTLPPDQVAAETVSLTPARPDPAGLDPKGELMLVSSRPLKAAVLRENLTVEPAVDLKVEQLDRAGTRFAISPARELAADRVYRFRLAEAAGLDRSYQWSFQTRTEFRLLGTLPADQATGVPVNTGIEFTFSHEDYGDPAPYFSISPAVEGRFERHGKTVSFVPSKPLQPGTVYTVTLKKGLSRTEGEGSLAADRTFAFETAEESGGRRVTYYINEAELTEFTPGRTPAFRVYPGGKEAAVAQVQASVYRYPDAESYIKALQKVNGIPWWASATRSRYREPVEGLSLHATFETEVQSQGYEGYLVFPEPLPPGYYLADVKVGEDSFQLRFQVTDLSYYVAETTTGTLVWLNDLATGGPAAGVTVSLPDGGESAMTDARGVAVLKTTGGEKTGAERPALFLIARSGEKEAVLYSPSQYWYWYGGVADQGLRGLYWKYLYLDRSLYRPNDQLHLWGIVHPREAEAAPVEKVRVEVLRSDYRRWDGEALPLVSAELPVENSTFTGSLKLPNLTPGNYELQLSVDGEPFRSQWFEVATYSKPAYQIEVTADQEALFTGEQATFRVKASFFEGTPVPGMKVNYSLSKGESGSVTTDESGEAVIRYTPGHQRERIWGPEESLHLYVTAGEAEVGEVTGERSVRLFLRDVMADSSVSRSGGEATVTVQLNRVVLDQINSGEGREYKGPAAAGQTVEFTLVEQNWKRVAEGQIYDFIEKVFRPIYRYEPAHREVATATAVTDEAGQATYTFTPDPTKRYEVRFRIADSRGLAVTGSQFVAGDRFVYPEPEEWAWPNLRSADEDLYRIDIGEPVEYVFYKGENRAADRPQSFLFFTARRGLQEYVVQDSAAYRLAMKAADVPNLHLYAVHFDGKRYLSAGRTIWFDQERRRLQVTVTPDRPEYRPGDEVRVDITVKDPAGRPAAGAVVNLNLVDEALFALRDQNVNILGSLYGEMVDSGVLRTRSSHELMPTGAGAEKGGDGGGVRRDFKDAVLFTSVTTDSSGQASATFRVPDNLTTWRLTYQAVRPESMEAENGSVGIPVKLPFFVDLVLGESFLAGEQPVFQVRAYGTELASFSGQVKYLVEVETPSGSRQEKSLTGQPFTAVSVPLEALAEEGVYRVRVSAQAGSLADALERTFTVLSTHLRQERVDFAVLEPGMKLSGAQEGLTTLSFLDWERGRYLELLQQMRWQWGNRFEKKLARVTASDLLRKYFDWQEEQAEPELETMRYQTQVGSIAILPYSDGDLKLSALAADLAPERFDQVALSLYFQRVLEDEGESLQRKIMALYGLAALDRPVLITAQELLAGAEMEPLDQLYLLLALAELGDLETVRPHYERLMETYGEEIGRDLRLTLGDTRDAQLEATALAASLSGKLGEPDTPRLLSYLAENKPEESLVQLELLLAIESGLERIEGDPVSFTYRLGEQPFKKELTPGERFELALPPEELADLRIEAVEGSVAVVATYTLPGKPSVEKEGGSVERTYSPAPEEWKPGDIVTVTLNYTLPADAPSGSFELTDTLPSNLRYVERPWQYGVKVDWTLYESWPLHVDGQRVTFSAGSTQRPIQYRARVIAPGEYRAEEAVLQHEKSGLIYGMSDASPVKVQW